MKRILLLGVGYVGGAFRDYMKRFPDFEVTPVSSRGNLWRQTDFAGYDAVFNASGLAHANARKGSEQDYYDVNGRLPAEMAQKAKEAGVPLFIHMSSIIVYGDMSGLFEEKTVTEATAPRPSSVYGESKRMAEESLLKMEDETFRTAIIRAPLVYGENAGDNFGRLVRFAKICPVFPDIPNAQSMVYAENLCELVRRIAESGKGGFYYPQQKEMICTSRMVADIAAACGKHMKLTKAFNPLLKFLSRRVSFIRKAFGSLAYAPPLSEHFGYAYETVSYRDSIRRIADKGKKK